MLPKDNRLKKKMDFTRIYRKGRSYSTLYLWIKVLPNHLDHNRIGFVVSRKVSKKAVTRNQIKRRLRFLMRSYLPLISPGYDIVLTGRREIIKKSYQEVSQTLHKLLQKTQLLIKQ